MNDLIELVSEQYNRNISSFNTLFLQKVVAERSESLSIKMHDYCGYLAGNSEEILRLFDSLSVTFSEFFRNSYTFSLLEHFIIPLILNRKEKTGSREVRIWSAGCASGQEAYSVGILFMDYINRHSKPITCRIFATDISEPELENARTAIYNPESLRGTKLDFLLRYFTRSGNNYMVNSDVRHLVQFSNYDLLDTNSSSPPSSIYGDFDLILCCNVLIYYNDQVRKKVLDKLWHALQNEGFLITGMEESGIISAFGGFSRFSQSPSVFTRKLGNSIS